MPLSLSPDLDAIINQHIESGRYADANAVLRDALRMLDEREQRLLWLHDRLAREDLTSIARYTLEP